MLALLGGSRSTGGAMFRSASTSAQRGLAAATKAPAVTPRERRRVDSVDGRGPRRTSQGVRGPRQLAWHALARDPMKARVMAASVTGNDRIFSGLGFEL